MNTIRYYLGIEAIKKKIIPIAKIAKYDLIYDEESMLFNSNQITNKNFKYSNIKTKHKQD